MEKSPCSTAKCNTLAGGRCSPQRGISVVSRGWIFKGGQFSGDRLQPLSTRNDPSPRVPTRAASAAVYQKAIYDALGIDPAPGGVRKMIV